ncbi:hypothetical protein ACSBLW_07145 [Thioclava sp. FR2]|uniref:hypothetical protein n=1 Tax=Thioclava sp. FR2 TaxID=3445780 RepID=UPI003EB8FEB9
MGVLGWQALGMGLLTGSILWGFSLWRQRLDHIPDHAEGLAALTLVATCAGGFWGAFAWAPNYPYAFSWALPGLAAKMLAAAGWSFALAAFLALRKPFATHLRMVVAMLWVYLAPLTLAILTQHLARLDFGRAVTWAFFAIVLALLLASSVTLWHLRNFKEMDGRPAPALRLCLLGIAGVSGAWALALFLWPNGPLPLIWPWQGDPLTTRLIASMFLSVATGAWIARASRSLAQTALWVTLAYGLGVVIAVLAHALTGQATERGYAGGAFPVSYMVVWGGLGLCAALALLASRPAR